MRQPQYCKACKMSASCQACCYPDKKGTRVYDNYTYSKALWPLAGSLYLPWQDLSLNIEILSCHVLHCIHHTNHTDNARDYTLLHLNLSYVSLAPHFVFTFSHHISLLAFQSSDMYCFWLWLALAIVHSAVFDSRVNENEISRQVFDQLLHAIRWISWDLDRDYWYCLYCPCTFSWTMLW